MLFFSFFFDSVASAQYETVFVNKPRGGEGSNRRRRERANYCKVYVSGSGLERDIFSSLLLHLLSRQRQHSTGINVPSILSSYGVLVFLLTLPLRHLIPPSLDLEAHFVLLICLFFLCVSSLCCSG